MVRTLLTLIVGFVSLSSAGCATVISGRTADVAVNSEPSDARVTVRDTKGVVVAKTNTPGSVTLKRNRKWLLPARYEATFEKEGFVPSVLPIEPTLNPWAIGNVAIGGGLGVGVDAVTGAIWKPKKSSIETMLAAREPSMDYSIPASYEVTPNDESLQVDAAR